MVLEVAWYEVILLEIFQNDYMYHEIVQKSNDNVINAYQICLVSNFRINKTHYFPPDSFKPRFIQEKHHGFNNPRFGGTAFRVAVVVGGTRGPLDGIFHVGDTVTSWARKAMFDWEDGTPMIRAYENPFPYHPWDDCIFTYMNG